MPSEQKEDGKDWRAEVSENVLGGCQRGGSGSEETTLRCSWIGAKDQTVRSSGVAAARVLRVSRVSRAFSGTCTTHVARAETFDEATHKPRPIDSLHHVVRITANAGTMLASRPSSKVMTQS